MRNLVVLILLLSCIVAKGQDSTFIVNLIEIEGNKITKNYIIEKEITFQDITRGSMKFNLNIWLPMFNGRYGLIAS